MGFLRNRLVVSSRGLLIAGVVVVVLALMAADTTFLNAAESAEASGPIFTAEEYAAEKFPEIARLIEENALDLNSLAADITADRDAAGAQFGQSLGAGRYAFQVKTTAEVTAVEDGWIILDPAGLPPEADLRIPTGPALTGNAVRDATGTIAFGDFQDQTDYQSVANQFKLIIQRDIVAPIDLDSLVGRTVSVTGAMVSGTPADAYYIQPVTLEVVE
jgi:predicted lipoprotein